MRVFCMGAALLLGCFAGAAAAQGTGPQGAPSQTAARSPLVTPNAASWSCQDGHCSYRKAQGAWSDCFTAWSPTHGGWLPTRYCR